MYGATSVLQQLGGYMSLQTLSLDTVSLGERIVKRQSREYIQNLDIFYVNVSSEVFKIDISGYALIFC